MRDEAAIERMVAQWYHTGLTECEAKKLIGHIPGAKTYANQLVSYSMLPHAAKMIVRCEYNKLCAECW